MKRFKFSVFTIIILVFLSLGAIFLLFPNRSQEVKGEINILASDESYDYLVDSANSFMEKSKKTKINITKASGSEYISRAKAAIDSDIDIVQLDSVSMYKLNSFQQKFEDNKEIVETYKNNFTAGRINEVTFSNEVKGVPLTSRPLVLYVREDMLSEFGYNYEDINTWEDVIIIGQDLFEKSGGKIRLLNAAGKDLEDLYSLLIMQHLEKGNSEFDNVVTEVTNFINMLNEKNILNTSEQGGFAVRISSINGMKDIAAITENCKWVASYPPTIKAGGNKFYVAEGSNLVLISEDEDNKELASEFISYLTTNTNTAIDYARKGDFFPSYLYTYKDKAIEQPINNFIVKSPLIIMDNIIQKAPTIKKYELYREVKSKFVDN